jgi:hypothetical protein
MPSLKLSNLFRRGSARPSLKDRAAGLRASLGTLRNPATLQLAPGSAEAKTAWRAACHQHSIRALPLHDCPDLDHPTGGAWTTRELMRAMEAGEITVAEFARLQPIASLRELRFAEIAHELRIGELFALAHADEYPVASRAEAPAPRAPDPILAAIAASRRAEAAVTAFSASVTGRSMTDAERSQEDAIEREQQVTRAAVWTTVPETDEGRAALARYVVFQAELLFGPDWRAKMDQEFCGDLLLALLAAFAPAAMETASEGERA